MSFDSLTRANILPIITLLKNPNTMVRQASFNPNYHVRGKKVVKANGFVLTSMYPKTSKKFWTNVADKRLQLFYDLDVAQDGEFRKLISLDEYHSLYNSGKLIAPDLSHQALEDLSNRISSKKLDTKVIVRVEVQNMGPNNSILSLYTGYLQVPEVWAIDPFTEDEKTAKQKALEAHQERIRKEKEKKIQKERKLLEDLAKKYNYSLVGNSEESLKAFAEERKLVILNAETTTVCS